jgi:formylglycine-generating enzyme required for sulfatase activity
VLKVGIKPASLYGLKDMIGNSYEWVADWYTKSYEKCGDACAGINPKGPCEGSAKYCKGHRRKVVRGGSWYWGVERNNAVYRRAHIPANKPAYHHFGFRCAASPDEAKALIEKAAAPK